MDHPLRDHLLFATFVTCAILLFLFALGLILFASQRKRTLCSWGIVFSILTIAALFIFSPGPDRAAKSLATVESLNPGYYEIDDVWQVGKRVCAILQPERWDGEDKTNRILLMSPTSERWILCDVTATEIVGRSGKLKNHPFTGHAIVTETNGVRAIRMYLPFR